MSCLCILLLMLCESARSFPVDTIIVQVQQWKVVGAQQVVDQVLLNGVSLAGTSHEVDSIIKTMLPNADLPALTSVNKTSVLRNCTVLRSRECILEGSQLHWTDRVFCDGKVYLTLNHTDTWIAHEPQALALKVLFDQDVQRTKTERIHLQEGCIKLMRELRLSVEQSVPGTPLPQFLIPVLALLVLTVLFTISFLLSKKQGLRHPGGVIGSVIHYPKNMNEMASEIKNNGYRTL